ncbi:MAG TPA: hypothetical protein VGM63_21035 [Mucilaginibacter sp.]
MKRYILILFVALAVYSGCKKDDSSLVTLTTGDLATINGQLKGSWVFPVETLRVPDSNGKDLVPPINEPASAYEFDGVSTVIIRSDPLTALTCTYSLSTVNGMINIHIIYPDNTTEDDKVALLNPQSLTLSSSEPYTYYNGTQLVPTVAVTTNTLQRLSSADESGNLARVLVNVNGNYSVKVYVTHQRGNPSDTTVLIGSKTNISGAYSLGFVAINNDLLKVDVLGDPLKTSINAYFRGIPISGQIYSSANETVTTTGWIISFTSNP